MGKFGNFRVNSWDPVLLISQIVAVQSAMYFSLGILMCFMDFLAESNHTLDHLFIFQQIKVSDSEGRLVIFAYLINSLIGALILWIVVKRTKLCLDFSCTYHLIHLIVCICYNGVRLPNLMTMLMNFVCATIMCICAEFLCLKSEMREIPVGYQALNNRIDL